MDDDKPSWSIARRGTTALAEARPNPQGKGTLGFLLDWDYSSPRGVVAKRAPQLLADYFTSLLVLSAGFRFKPVFGKDYYLYVDGDGWMLSLISPEEWNTEAKRSAFVGQCILHDDSTWSITPSDNVGEPGEVNDALARFYDGFLHKLESEETLEDELPFYEPGRPYYQRLFATQLSRSMKASLTLGDQLGRSSGSWLERLPAEANLLLVGQKPKE